MNDDFEGIILNLIGNELPDNTQCSNTTATVSGGVPDGKTVGTYENLGRLCQCWAYAEGGTDSLSGIELDPGSRAQFRPGASWSFQSGLFEGPPPTSFALKNWRELYSLDE